MVKALETYRPLFMVVTFGFLGSAFYLTYRPRRGVAKGIEDWRAPSSSGKRRFNMMTLNKVMLWAVTAMAVVFLFFPGAVTGLFASSGEFTDDMDRTLIKVEGMTCPG
jgi:hypothetical protein